MCGIAGILRWQGPPIQRCEIEQMTGALAHRGPDAEGFLIRDRVALGHRRLSIIDVEGGKQPLCNEDETVWVTFNGEIYNYRELREVLQTEGHVFRTKSDTEVIVHAYEEWGDSCVERFRGMFAFAVLDERARRLFLARDHLGIKPLYYLHTNTFFAFASELQSLRVLAGLDWSLDLEALDDYLWLEYIPAPRTIYRNVSKMPPGNRFNVCFDGSCEQTQKYWQLEFIPNKDRSEADTLAELDHVLRRSAKYHLVADVSFGAFLSGGVDSSVVVGYMSELLGRPVKTFTIGFEEDKYSELPFARQASGICGTEHYEEIVKPDALNILPDLVRHYGEPFGDSSAIPTYYLSRLARNHVPMVLSGDGGDESFAGYDTHRAWMRSLHSSYNSSYNRPLWKRSLRPLAEKLMPWRYEPRSVPQISLSHWLSFVERLPTSLRQRLWRREFQTVCTGRLPVFEKEYDRVTNASLCSRVQYLDIKTFLPNDILTKIDIASMAHGLEVRTPLVDVDVVQFAATIPADFHIGRNSSGQWEGKKLLKRIATQWFPEDFVRRKKRGFTVPLSIWFSKGGILDKATTHRLRDATSPLTGYFTKGGVNGIINKRSPGPIWLLLFLDEWLRYERQIVSELVRYPDRCAQTNRL
jgi:asparagine synthase (glutamine-hydrolysing)